MSMILPALSTKSKMKKLNRATLWATTNATAMKRMRLSTALVLFALIHPSFVRAQKSSDVRVNADLPGTHASAEAQIAASGDSVYICWTDTRNGLGDIYFNHSLDGGATWLNSDIRLDTDPAGSANSPSPQIAISGNSLYVVWIDLRDGRADIYFNRSLDSGTTWLPSDIRLDTDLPGTSWSGAVKVAASGGSVYVTWQDSRNGGSLPDDIYFNRSLDGGATWLATDLRLNTDQPGVAFAANPQIATSGESVYVTWIDARDDAPLGTADIYFNRSLDSGATWISSDTRLNTDLPGVAGVSGAQIAVSGDCVYVTWDDGRNGNSDIFLNRSVDGGATWLSTDIRLNQILPLAAAALGPGISVAGDAVYVIWDDRRNGQSDTYFNRSLDRGVTWLANDLRLDTDQAGASDSYAAQIVSSGDSIHVTWIDRRNDRFDADIYYNRSIDGGTTWLTSDIRLNTDLPGAASSMFPKIAASGDSVYVAWEDDRNGFLGRDIYFNIPFGAQPYGEGTAGSGAFVPRLDGTDSLTLGSTFTLTITDGVGGALGVVAIGGPNSKASIPFAGGSLLLNSIIRTRSLLLDGSQGVPGDGAVATEFIIPIDSAFLGANFNFQAAFLDSNAVFGLALTNGVEVWIL